MNSRIAQVRTLSKKLSPAQAGKRAGVSRWTVMRALNSKDLFGERDNKNNWLIEPSEVDRWVDARSAHQVHAQPDAHPIKPTDDRATEVAVLKKEIEGLRRELELTEKLWSGRLEDATSHWERQVDRLQAERDELKADLIDLATPWWRRWGRR